MIKEGDYLYCHSDGYHMSNRFMYDKESKLIFKAGRKYKVLEVNNSIKDDPFLTMENEMSGIFLISAKGTTKCSHIKRFYTMDQLRELKLENLLD